LLINFAQAAAATIAATVFSESEVERGRRELPARMGSEVVVPAEGIEPTA